MPNSKDTSSSVSIYVSFVSFFLVTTAFSIWLIQLLSNKYGFYTFNHQLRSICQRTFFHSIMFFLVNSTLNNRMNEYQRQLESDILIFSMSQRNMRDKKHLQIQHIINYYFPEFKLQIRNTKNVYVNHHVCGLLKNETKTQHVLIQRSHT